VRRIAMEKKALGEERPAEEIRNWPKVATIILNWNGWPDTIECLESVERLTYPNYEVVLVDNGSVDDSVARIREWVMNRPGQGVKPKTPPKTSGRFCPHWDIQRKLA